MSNNRNGWLGKAEAAELLGCSVRTLERYAKSGKVESGSTQGKYGSERMYSAESIEALKAELETPAHVVVDQMALEKREHDERRLSSFDRLSDLLESLLERTAPALLEAAPDGVRGSVPIADRLMLGLPEAAELTGLKRGYLLKAIKAGKLRAEKRPKAWNIKRADLDAWIKKL